MKKMVALLLAAVMCLSLAACGSNEHTDVPQENETQAQATKDELLAQAKEVDANDINNACYENLVKAKSDYCNQTLQLTGMIKTFVDNYVELTGVNAAKYLVDVYLPEEELLKLKSGQSIVVVGQTTDEIKKETVNIAGMPWDTNHLQMPVAYLVKDTFEFTGVLKGPNTSNAPAFNIEIGKSNYWMLIYFADGVDTSTLERDQKITFSAKAIYENPSWHYYDAQIIG